MNVLAIDPGNITGWALYRRNILVEADLIDYKHSGTTNKFHFFYHKCLLNKMIIEFPRIYDRRNWLGDPNDLLEVACCAGHFLEQSKKYGSPCERISPQQWKGQRPKSADHKYTKRLLNEEELKIVTELEKKYAKDKVHNVLDAIGIGLYAVGRR